MKLRLLPVLVVVLLGLTGCNLQPNDRTLPGQVAVGSDGYGVTVYFDQVANLVSNSTVQMDNVVIGTVAGIDVSDWQAKVRLRLLKSARVPSEVIFSIGQKTLLGAQYVDVSATKGAAGPGAAGRAAPSSMILRDGDVIRSAQTGTFPGTEQVLGAVALLLNNGGLSQIQTITSQLSTALNDRVPDTRSLVRRTNELLGVLDENKSEVVGAIEALDRLSTGLVGDRARLSTAIDRLAPGLKALEEERQSLVRAVTETGRTGVQATRVIRASRAAILGNLDSLRPILTNLAEVGSTLPDALKLGVTIPFPAMTTTQALRGDFANLFTTLDLRGSSLVGSWLGGLLPIPAGATPPSTSQGTGSGTGSGTTGGSSPGAPEPASPSPGETVPTPKPRPCLLAILGVC